jgi:DNA-binding NarL/FixJ family response regulator
LAKRWSPEEDELIIKLRNEGFSAKEIAVRLKSRTYTSVRTRLAKIAVDNLKRPWTEEEKAEALELKSQGQPNKFIAYKLGRTVAAVVSFFNRNR